VIANLQINAYFLKDFQVKVSQDFTVGEFACRKTSTMVLLAPTLITLLQQLRTRLNKPVHITSGYRTPEYNAKIKGAAESRHMLGLAADLEVPKGTTNWELAGLAYVVGFRRIGVAHGFIHVDIAPGEAYWCYSDELKTGLESKIRDAAGHWA